MQARSYSRGMTLVEVFIALAIFVAVIGAVYAFELGIFSNQQTVSGSFQTAQNAQAILKNMLAELRSASPSANGVYPLAAAATSTLTFYSSPLATSTIEEISYALKGSTLYRAVTLPSGTPAIYNPATTATTTVLTGVTNGTTTDLFQYFDQNYTGTSSPLIQPVNLSSVTLVKINLVLDVNPKLAPAARTYTTQAAFRNLKTNL